jgi:peptide-methionine (S)-S-oxide reductase
MKSIIFAGGCFWGVQHYFNMVRGVLYTRVGYTSGRTESPTYKEVCSGRTGHTEACLMEYDNKQTNLVILLDHFFNIIDPTLLNRQGNDVGTQYRTGVYYLDESEKKIIENYFDNVKGNYKNPIVVEIAPAGKFWDAEENHQDYLINNPGGYCHIGANKYQRAGRIDEEARMKYKY